MTKKRNDDNPAPVVAKHPEVAIFEKHFRQLTHIAKRAIQENPGFSEQLKRDGLTDPSASSAVASASVMLMDAALFHVEKFVGRKPQSISKETKYIRGLCLKYPHETASGLWSKLRLAASHETPDCPFRFGHRSNGQPVLVNSRGREVTQKSFANRVSEFRRGPRKSPGPR